MLKIPTNRFCLSEFCTTTSAAGGLAQGRMMASTKNTFPKTSSSQRTPSQLEVVEQSCSSGEWMMSAKSSSDSHIHSVVFSGTNVGGMSSAEI